MKTLTYNAVANAALLLLAASPIEQTTSLEVKNILRALNFKAEQKFVSDSLVALGDALELNVKTVTENNATFRVYSLKPFEDEVEEDGSLFTFRK